KPPTPVAEVTVDPSTLAAYVGTYQKDNLQLKVTFQGGKLRAGFDGGQAMDLRATAKDSFKWGGVSTIAFHTKGDQVTGLTMKYGTNEMAFARVHSKAPMKNLVMVED